MGLPILKADGGVSFADAQAFRDHYQSHLSKGTLLVAPQRPVAPQQKLDLTLLVPGGAPLKAKAEVFTAKPDGVLLRLNPFDEPLRQSLKQAASPPNPPAQPAAPETAGAPSATQLGLRAPTMAIAATGDFVNPKLPQDFLALPVTRAPSAEQMATPATVTLWMWLLNRKSEIVTLKVTSGARQAEVTVVKGEFALVNVPPDSALKTLAEPAGTYEVQVLAVEPKVRYRQPAPSFGLALLKEYTKHFIEPDYAAAMSGRHGQSPKMSERGKTLVRTVGLSDVQQRIANRMLTGNYSLDEVLNNGVGIRSSWQMVFLMQVPGGLEWADPPPRQSILIDEMQATLQRIRGQDHFTALGLHLTSSPKTVERTYQRLRTQYGPGSASQKLSPQVCNAIWAFMESCYKTVADPTGRRAYRASAFPGVRLEYSAQLVYEQARLAMLRREVNFALDLMEAVLELCPTKEYLEAYKKMRTGG